MSAATGLKRKGPVSMVGGVSVATSPSGHHMKASSGSGEWPRVRVIGSRVPDTLEWYGEGTEAQRHRGTEWGEGGGGSSRGQETPECPGEAGQAPASETQRAPVPTPLCLCASVPSCLCAFPPSLCAPVPPPTSSLCASPPLLLPFLPQPMVKKNAKSQHARNEPEIHNRKVRHLYHIDETLECGIKLVGTEVKSVRAGRISIGEGYVVVREEPPVLEIVGIHIDEYAPAGAGTHRPTQTRTLLAHKREIRKLARKTAEKGITIVPLKVYFKNGYVKVLIGVGRGKREYDKRQDIKTRETDRDLRRVMSKRV